MGSYTPPDPKTGKGYLRLYHVALMGKQGEGEGEDRFLQLEMSYDDVEIEDMEWNEELKSFTYPCPCGDLFQITKEELSIGEEIARCPSCSLYITVVYNMEDFIGDLNNKNMEPSKRQSVAVV
ncbi:hypothetical protein C5167_030736 [Papaver somniferum]|nr:hypothetical protein C5167_030736 [Papaver somniferum]